MPLMGPSRHSLQNICQTHPLHSWYLFKFFTFLLLSMSRRVHIMLSCKWKVDNSSQHDSEFDSRILCKRILCHEDDLVCTLTGSHIYLYWYWDSGGGNFITIIYSWQIIWEISIRWYIWYHTQRSQSFTVCRDRHVNQTTDYRSNRPIYEQKLVNEQFTSYCKWACWCSWWLTCRSLLVCSILQWIISQKNINQW